jgi:type I restriction enzyme S subunit
MTNKVWPKIPLKSLSSRIGDGIHGTPKYVEDSDYPFINGNNLKNGFIEITPETKKVSAEEYKKHFIEFDGNTLFLSINGTLGSLAKYRGENVILGKSAAYIKCTKINIDFLYYYLQLDSLQKCMWDIATGSTIKNLSLDSIRNLQISTPEIPEQKKIAAVLSSLDAKIELNNRINNELESITETLYDYWFIQFNFPDHNGKPYKSSGGKLIYNNTLKREIPVGWSNSALGHICELYQPKTISEKEFSENGTYLVYGANGIIGKYNQFNHSSSMVTITCRGNTCGAINVTRPFSWITGNAMVVKPKEANLSIDYLYRLLKWADISTVITGSAQPQITRTNLAPLKIISPDTSLLKKFNEITEASFEMRMKNLAETEQLTKLRDWLLPMLMNGQVQIAG